MNNYIMINGKKIELTDEQIKTLQGLDKPKHKTPWDRVEVGKIYSYINEFGTICYNKEKTTRLDDERYLNLNCYNNKDFCHQMKLHWLLYKKLYKFSLENGWSEDLWRDRNVDKWFYMKNAVSGKYDCYASCLFKDDFKVYFVSQDICQQAVEEIIKPFREEHPEYYL